MYQKKYMNNNFLSEFGFSDKEYDIYHLLVTRGPLSIADIVVHSNLHRPYAYKTIDKLVQKKVVTLKEVKSKKLYVAEHPSKLREVLEDKKLEQKDWPEYWTLFVKFKD